MARFTDRTVIVTGAASGIGRATALRLGSEGAAVACVDLAQQGAEKTAAEIATARAYSCNVADPVSVEATVASVVSDLGLPHVVCNIAGIGKFAHTHEQPVEEWERIIAVNLTGTYLMCRATIPLLLERGGGVIVNTASNAGILGQPYSAAYSASKGGVVMLTRALAYEYIKRGIRVNAVAPGGTQTPLVDSFGFPDGADAKLFAKITSPMGWASPEEMAGLFAFVASDEARYMTGSILSMDGGLTC
ncbi:MAG: SDR family NAD(P)-dependent oxidoreductase [Acidimicrobiales bacterium]